MELHRKYHKEQLKSITDFAESLYADVLEQNSSATISENKLNTLNQNIDIAVQITQIHEPSIRTELDTVGTKLWNACTRTMRKDGLETATIEFLSRARGFAFLMLECAVGRQREDCSDDIRLLRTALKTVKSCIVLNQLDIGLKILEKAALREKQLSKGPKDSGEKNDIPLKLSAEYYILRSNLAWKQGRLDFAEHMLSKLPRQVLQQDVALTERLSDLLFDIGKNLMDRKEYADAEKWLQRALDALSQEPLDMLTPDARELRLCILYGLVRVNLDLKYTNSETKAMDLHIVLEKEYGHRLEVLLLGLDVIQAQKSPDSQRYYDRLCAFMRIAPASESNFKLMIHHILQLQNWDKGLATDVLEQLLLQRFASHGIENLIERGFITYIWMKTASPGVDDGLESLRTVVAKLTETWKSRLSGEATHAALILIWKKVTAAFDVKEYGSAQSWCQLALHPIFGNAGESNISKIKRKLILCALERNDTKIAREILSGLSETCKSEPLTRYLMYRVALKDEDLDLGRDCLEILCQSDTEQATYLMACIAEALHSDAERQAAIALQKLLDYLDGKGLREIHFPALLLCTARLLITELDRNELKPEIVSQICKIFESLQVAVARDALDTGQLTVPELEWFSRNSYNLALQYCTTWEPQYILRLLNACIQIINLYPENLGEEARKDIELRNMLCHFLAAIITVAQARTQNDPETKKGFYRDARMHIQGFRERVLPLMEQSLEEKTLEDCLKKYRTLLAFDFEAAVRLNQWDSLGEILHQSQTIADSALYSLYADALLCSGAPTEKLLKIFQQIITQATHQRNLQNLEKTSRWIRCLFQFAIGSDIQIAESVLDQAYVLARDGGAESHRQDQNSVRPQGRQSPIKTAYPEEELEWLSTTAFNQAIDFYLASDDGASRRWYGKALDLARLLSDNGSLWHTLQEKYERLSWDD